ncbi:MAG: response regulator [Deltaproteobacteria bacterium]|nr:response regulator [Deltaproteobacteria bacterium]
MSSTVLVVDDETEIRDTVADNFRKRGCTVLTAANGADALRLVNEQKVQAVVTDVRMPRMSGLELLDQLKGLPGDSPAVVLMSGYADVTIDEVYHRGAEALFHEPGSRHGRKASAFGAWRNVFVAA